MQGKGLIRTFLILFVLVCLYYLSFTFITARANSKATKHAKELVDSNQAEDFTTARTNYLDSIANKNIVDIGPLEYTYNECKERQLNLGLDLQGGMSSVLQVSLVDLIKYLSSETADPNFHQAIDMANEAQKNSDENYVTLFGQAFEQIAPGARLAAIFSTPELKDKVNYNSTNQEVLEVIREKADEAVNSTFKIIRTRIDQFGVASPNVQLQENTGRIIVELPGVDNPDRVRKLLEATAKLEFWETDENSGAQGIGNRIFEADSKLKELLDAQDPTRITRLEELNKPTNSEEVSIEEDTTLADDTTGVENDSISSDLNIDNLADAAIDTTEAARNARAELSNPLLSVFTPSFSTQNGRQVPAAGSIVGYAFKKDTAKVNEYLSMRQIKSIFPATTKLVWAAKPFSNPGESEAESADNPLALYALKSRFSPPRPRMEGDVILDAAGEFGQTGKPVVNMRMNSIGSKEWSKMTGENIKRQVAVVLDNKVYSAPTVQAKISGGNTEISGNFNVKETKDLANILKAGSLPARPTSIEEAVVGPSLGADSIKKSLRALIIGLVLVLIFMVLYYNNGGLVANLALILNLFFIIGILAALGATLTLPGMAGIVLTVGMAVDANVLIFERIREELLKGSGIKKAIADGYQKSYSAILDANFTTFITAVILALFGLGPVLGFAVILIIGILSSLFTAIFVARLVFDSRLNRNKEPQFWTGFSRGAFKDLNFDFISKRRIAYMVAGFLVLAGITSMAIKGFDLGVDFSGGRTYVVKFDKPAKVGEIRAALTDKFNNAPVVKSFSTANQVKITTSYKIDESNAAIDDEIEGLLHAGVKGFYDEEPSFEKFTSEYRLSSQKVGPTIADDIKTSSIWASLIALTLIFLYILFRFRKWQYGLGAIIALAVNVAIVMGFFSIFAGVLPFTLEIDQAFIAAILTVIGYSINDTVVVFDRIREYLGIYTKQPMKEVINSAINSTLSRTLITSLTTLFVVTILFIFGGEVIRGFAFALLIGIIVGTLSSVFIATPIVTDLTAPERKRVVHNERAERGQKKKKRVTA